jgi:hypothetical protein
MSNPRLQPGDLAPNLTLLDISGNHTELASYWPDGPTFLTFLRHFG